MKKGFLAFVCMAWGMLAVAQQNLQVLVKGKGGEPLTAASVSVTALNRAGISDSLGTMTLRDLPAGRWTLAVSHVGYEPKEVAVDLPQATSGPVIVVLEAAAKEEQEVVVTSTRSNRSIRNIPTRSWTKKGICGPGIFG
jgi:outer membrane receptor for ferrienterochelin and colicins